MTNNRSCGSCVTCCYMPTSDGVTYNKCEYVKDTDSHRCGVYGTKKRPSDCDTFVCGWLRGYGDEMMRPDRSNVMIAVYPGAIYIFELTPDAASTTGSQIVEEMRESYDRPIKIVEFY